MARRHATGRRYAPDRRDRRHKIPRRRSQRTFRYWDTSGWHGDQGNISACVGFAWAHWLAASPVRQWVDPVGIYQFAQFVDEWPGEDYEGTSVRAGAKVLKRLGAIASYKWADSVDVLVNHVLEVGPVVVGTDYFQGMEYPKDGIMRATGEFLGGHAYLISGVNKATGWAKVKNSRPKSWGLGGYGWISFDTLAELIAADGEVCCGVERQLAA